VRIFLIKHLKNVLYPILKHEKNILKTIPPLDMVEID